MSTPLIDLTQVGRVSHESSIGGSAAFELGTKVTVGAQGNRRLLAWIGNLNGGVITGVKLDTAGGAPFTFVGTVGRGGYSPLELWYLDSAPAGDHTVYVSSTDAGLGGVAILESWYDVDPAVAPSWSATAGDSSIAPSSTATQAVSCGLAVIGSAAAPTCTDGTTTAQVVDVTGQSYDQLMTARKLGAAATAPFAFSGADTPNVAAAVLNYAAAVTPTAVKLGVLTQPTEGQTHHSFTITIAVQDAGGATITGNTASVTLSPSGTGTATFLGNLTVSAVAGVATFTLTPTKNTEDASITFTASSGSLTPAVASAITLKVQSLDVTVS